MRILQQKIFSVKALGHGLHSTFILYYIYLVYISRGQNLALCVCVCALLVLIKSELELAQSHVLSQLNNPFIKIIFSSSKLP